MNKPSELAVEFKSDSANSRYMMAPSALQVSDSGPVSVPAVSVCHDTSDSVISICSNYNKCKQGITRAYAREHRAGSGRESSAGNAHTSSSVSGPSSKMFGPRKSPSDLLIGL